MPELRTDWLLGRAVLVAENRARRPNEFAADARTAVGAAGAAAAAQATTDRSAACPFCAGNESRTPPAVYQSTDAHGQWRVRVVPNLYPAVSLEHASQAALGVHEVVIESPRHVERMSALSVAEFHEVLVAYASRLRQWGEDERFRYGLVFKNQGPQAGASLAHVHGQLIALPDAPPTAQRELHRAADDCRRQGSCAYCRLVDQERGAGARVVQQRDGLVAFCPFASLQPLEVWLMPAAHEPSFELLDPAVRLAEIAAALHALVARLEASLPGASYNWLVRTAPWAPGAADWFHWRIELLPRVTPIAGLELAAGLHINALPPERAAERLRAG